MLIKQSFTNGRCVHSKISNKGDYCCDFLLTKENIKPLLERLEELKNKDEDYFVFDKIEFDFNNDTLELHYLDRVENKLTMSEVNELINMLYEENRFLNGLTIDYKNFEAFQNEKLFRTYWLNLIYENIDSLYIISNRYIHSTKLPICLSKLDNTLFFDIDDLLVEIQRENVNDETVRVGSISINKIENTKLLELINNIEDEVREMS